MIDLAGSKAYLDQLDLSYITRKMCSPYYPMPRWQPELAAQCEQLYRRFLWLIVKYGVDGLVPTKTIDEFWHNHILYTENYTRDCNALVGHYIHHLPSDPEGEEIAVLAKQFEYTKELYQQEFAEPLRVFVSQ